MSSSGTVFGFNTTVWSLVTHARSDRSALEQLLRTYWAPIYASVRRRGFSREDASDLTQEFMTKVVLGRDLVPRADPSRGRFRAFLKTALQNFLIDHLRTQRGQKNAAEFSEIALERLDSDARDGASDSHAAFDRAWAAALVQQAADRTREQCEADGMIEHWAVFDAYVLGPSVRGRAAPTLEALAADMTPDGSLSPERVSNMVQTTKRKFRRALREVLLSTLATPDHVEQELRELRSALGT